MTHRKVGLVCLWLGACPADDALVARWDPPRDAGAVAQDAGRPGLYIEAERGALDGFTVVADARASNERAILPPEGSFEDAPGRARARYDFRVEAAGEYLVWARIHGPDVRHNRFWFAMDDAPFQKWRLSTGEAWFWDPLHVDLAYGMPVRFTLAAGDHTLVFAQCVSEVGLDALYITSKGDMPTGNDTPCNPPHSIELDGGCAASCGAQAGRACGEQNCAGRTLVEAYDCDICCLAP